MPYNLFKQHVTSIVLLFVSATRRGKDIKVLLCLSAPVSNDYGHTHKCDFSASNLWTNLNMQNAMVVHFFFFTFSFFFEKYLNSLVRET